MHAIIRRFRDSNAWETHWKAFFSVFEDFIIKLRRSIYGERVPN
jgi:hypothetical protein